MQSLLLILTVLAAVASACEWGWEEYNGHCYRLQSRRNTWTIHNFECVYEGGTLTSIKSEGENDFIRGLAGGREVYIGGASFGYSWEWADHSSFYGYSNWADQSDSYPPRGRPCIVMNPSGQWEAHCCANPPQAAVCVRRW
ncbi:hypothetical protein PFISCL1PPCAC_28080 [Pristionchus fissidentatus]|uniref:C-type lectin domain-containing protein n=1 Tax=Pristionchus fissidentatus TaxID=1538716 RepID=A0AAV5WZL3_9BILA|nr:hypothetical protein PFISCL1PPCAC_28080 [Pristionchus fissidentatus]